MLLAAVEPLHDELSGRPGALRGVLAAIQAITRARRQLLITVPVLRRNLRALGAIAALARKLGATRIQFAFPRPVELRDRVVTEPLPRLAPAAAAVRAAARLAAQLGMAVSTEAFPLCHLPPELHGAPDATEDFARHRVDDLHLLHESFADARRSQRPEPPPCRSCSARARCPKTWALYLELFGSDELTPI
jgi:hypothetical protein